jgi:hypothetical protein
MIMRRVSSERFSAANVLVEFESGPVSFRVRHGTTLGDVSEKLDKIGRWYGGRALSIKLRFGTIDESGGAVAQPFLSCFVSPGPYAPL